MLERERQICSFRNANGLQVGGVENSFLGGLTTGDLSQEVDGGHGRPRTGSQVVQSKSLF